MRLELMAARERALGTVYRREFDDHELSATVCPHVFMRGPDTKLDIRVTLKGGGEAGIKHPTKTVMTFTNSDVEALLAEVKISACACGQPAFDPATVETNREGQCERCFLRELNEWYERETAQERAEEAAEDAKAKLTGHRFKAHVWIHPAQGDDYPVMVYYKTKPTAVMLRRVAQQRCSRVLDDHNVVTL